MQISKVPNLAYYKQKVMEGKNKIFFYRKLISIVQQFQTCNITQYVLIKIISTNIK